jgi:hypothetical protein
MTSKFSPPAVAAPRRPTKSELLNLSSLEKLRSISAIMLYPAPVRAALQALNFAFHTTNTGGLATHVLLTGPRSTGKTRLAEHFLSLHPTVRGERFDEQPVIVTTPTARIDGRGMSEAILGDARWPLAAAQVGEKFTELQIERVLHQSSTRMLIFNRAERLAPGGRMPHASAVFLENLMDRGSSRIVLIGASDLVAAVKGCPALAERFDVRLELPALQMNSEWQKMCEALDKELPFVKTDINTDDMPRRLRIASQGRIPILMRLIQAASKIAMYDKKSAFLARDHLKVAFEQRMSGRINPFANVSVETAEAAYGDQPLSDYERGIRINNRPGA